MKIEAKMWPLQGEQSFKEIRLWPSSWPEMTYIRTWLRYQVKHSGKVSWTLTQLWPLEGEQGFKGIWLSDLDFDPTWPVFELDQDIIKTNILVKFHEDRSKTVASRGWTIDWLCWGLTTCQPLWVILCHLPEKGRKEIEEIVEEMKKMDREEIGTGLKVKKQNKIFPSTLTCYKDSRPCPTKPISVGRPGDIRYTTPSHHPTTP